jgi:hypothetical protein
MSSVSWRFLLADLLTNSILAELQLVNVSFSQALNSAGTFQGEILLTGLNPASNAINATIPGRTAIYAERQAADGTRVLLYGGVVWERSYSSNGQRLKITAREFESYLDRRRITTTQAFTAVDQLIIAQTLVNQAQSATGGNIGISVPTNTSGVTVNKTYYSYELKTVYSALLDLSRAQNGFDFNIQVAYDGSGNPTKTLKLNYPQSGVRYSATNPSAPMFELPAGNVIEYTYPESGSIAANTVYVMGAGNAEGKLIATAVDTTKLSAGWPLLEDSANYSDISDATLLSSLAAGQLAAVSYPPTTLQIVTTASTSPVLGTYSIGDDARVRIYDGARFPNGLDATYRITALSVNVGSESGNSPERVVITLALPTS